MARSGREVQETTSHVINDRLAAGSPAEAGIGGGLKLLGGGMHPFGGRRWSSVLPGSGGL